MHAIHVYVVYTVRARTHTNRIVVADASRVKRDYSLSLHFIRTRPQGSFDIFQFFGPRIGNNAAPPNPQQNNTSKTMRSS